MAHDNPEIEIVAINDLVSPENLAYLLKYDSIHGRASFDVVTEGNFIIVDGKRTEIIAEKDPTKLPWKRYQVDFVIESTGRFTHFDEAKLHLEAGAKKVIISAPAKGEVPTFVMGVNHEAYEPNLHHVVF